MPHVAEVANPNGKRSLVGINNTMPGPGTGSAGRGYVILGPPASWASPPMTIAFDGSEHAVQKETNDYMVRGLSLGSASSVEATVTMWRMASKRPA